jgi:glutamine synthetase
LEWRLPDPSCNVYAAIAATLAAGLDGMERQLHAPMPCDEDLYERFASGQSMPDRLPRDLGLALDALAANQPLMDALGTEFCDQFLKLKRQEWDSYSQSVSGWEFSRYADQF